MILHLVTMTVIISNDNLMQSLYHISLPFKLLALATYAYLTLVVFASVAQLWFIHDLFMKGDTPPCVLKDVQQKFGIRLNKDILAIRLVWSVYLVTVILVFPFPIPFMMMIRFNYDDYWRSVRRNGHFNTFLLLRS